MHPALVDAIGRLAIVSGVGVPMEGLTVRVLAAALPSASNVSLLAERHGADNGRIACTILATTAVASFSALARVLGTARHGLTFRPSGAIFVR